MMRMILVITLCAFFIAKPIAQEDSITLQKFVRVYLTLQSKNNPESIHYDSILSDYLGDALYKKYTNYLSGNAGMDMSYFSDDELIKIHSMLGKVEKEIEQSKKELLKEVLLNEQLDEGTYQRIYSKYKSSILFADSLKPYFKDYIDQLKVHAHD